VARALVEQPDNVRVQLVNRLAMSGNVQAKVECRIRNEESNLFHATHQLDLICYNSQLNFRFN
jgi:hypothetical protein